MYVSEQRNFPLILYSKFKKEIFLFRQDIKYWLSNPYNFPFLVAYYFVHDTDNPKDKLTDTQSQRSNHWKFIGHVQETYRRSFIAIYDCREIG